jgi:DNA-binding transcriptional MerR regulator/methylmalonyl-CoA mutase cobalamin-binding subunit
METPHHSIKTASRLTGLSPHLIRIWEKRYEAVAPERTPTNRRLYTDAEIERLRLLRQATEAGHSIGNIATLPVERLNTLVAKAGLHAGSAPAVPGVVAPAQEFHGACLAAVQQLDSRGLEETMRRAVVALGHQGLLRQVVTPLAQTIGELWRTGAVTAAHEHFLTAALKVFLGRLSGQFSHSSNAPRIIVATPTGQLHELGAVIVNAAAAQIGWQTTYLGASLPAAEIAGAAAQSHARAVALSIVYPEDDPALPQELINLRRFLPAETKILVGGRAARAYLDTLGQIGAIFTESVEEFCDQLDALRRVHPGGPART